MDVNDPDSGRPVKRFKHQSYAQSLKGVHLPSALAQSQFDHEIPDDDSHFHESLDHWRQLNLSPAFLKFASSADALSVSMPMLLHHWRDVVELWNTALDASDYEGLVPLLDLMQKLAHDLRTTLLPVYQDILSRLLKFLPRKLPAPSLTALLSALSALYKYLLVPSTDNDLLDRTWSSLRVIIPKCNPEVKRAVAEVWGALLRRLKASAREKAVRLVAEGLEGVEDPCAQMLVFACESVSQTLHTATASIVSPLLKYHLSCGHPEHTYTLLRRLLIALVHHCKDADQFAPVADVFMEQFSTMVASVVEDSFRRMMEIMSILCCARQGSRLTQKHLNTLLSRLHSIPIIEPYHASLVKLSSSALTAADLSLWLGPGRKIIENSWGHGCFGIQLCGTLAEMQWGGWKLVALPHVVKVTPDMLEREPKKMVELLAALHRGKRLADMDLVWKKRVGGWVLGRLADWQRSEESVLEFANILTLSDLLPDLAMPLRDVIAAMLDTPDPRLDYESSYANAGWVLGTCMKTLAQREASEWVDHVDLTMWTGKVVEKWSWSETVMGGLVTMIQASPAQAQKISFDSVYPTLRDCLLSHSRSMRLSTLHLLTSHVVEASYGIDDTLKRCLQGEKVSLDVQGVRERTLKISRLALSVKDEASADVTARWLIAQFKVNLRPLWSHASEALVALSQPFGDLVWELVFSELKNVSQDVSDESYPPWTREESEDDHAADGIWEDEKSWRDLSTHNMLTIVSRWLKGDIVRKRIMQAQKPTERLDTTTYQSQLLNTLGACYTLAEKHNRDLISFFLSIIAPETPSKLQRPKLSGWLTLFSKFANPKAMYCTETLHSLYISLLSHPDRSLQELSLSCLLTYKSPHLLPHKDTLRTLLDDTRWRDELTMLDISSIEDKDRHELVGVLVRLLFGIMLEKRSRSRGADRRAAVLTALGGCTDEELEILVDLMLQPVRSERPSRIDGSFSILPVPEGVSRKQQLGFLTLLGDVQRNLGSRLVSRWPDLLGVTLDLVADAQKSLDSTKHEIEHIEDASQSSEPEDVVEVGGSSKSIRAIRQLGLKRFADFGRCPVPFDFTPYMTEAFRAFISPRLACFESENTQSPSGLLELFHVWATRKECVPFLVEYDDRVLPKIYDSLISTNVKPAVVSRVFDIIEHLLFSISDKDSQSVVVRHVSLLLTNLSLLVERSKDVMAVTTPLGQRQIGILCQIVDYLKDGDEASKLVGLFLPILRKPSKLVSEKIKVDLMNILDRILAIVTDIHDSHSPRYLQTYEVLSLLFQTLRSRQGRLGLLVTFHKLAVIDSSLQLLADLLESLNAYSTKRIEEPDFDRRFKGFTTLNETLYSSLSAREWMPVLYNMLYFIQDPEELAVRHSASLGIKRFIDMVAERRNEEYETVFMRVLYPALKNSLRTKHEMIRAEVLAVVAYAISKCDFVESFREMRILFAEGDEEANFFNNIFHVQIHRRTRALRRLADACDQGKLGSRTLAELLVPLVGHFVTSTASLDHHLVNEAIRTTGCMSKCLIWGSYYALVQQYLRLCQKKDESERVYVRALVAILDSFHFQMDDPVEEVGQQAGDEDNSEPQTIGTVPVDQVHPKASKASRIEDLVITRLLPSLLRHLENREETEDTLRIPIAVGIVKVANHLPQRSRESQISRLLTIITQALRSRSQETRDLVRETLCRIAVLLGPSHLPLMLREMRAALQRGPQLHVLAYAIHSLLVHVTGAEHCALFETLDACVEDVAHVSAEVVFGQSGQDVQSEEFKTKMREVRSSSAKALDSFGIIARFITPSRISSLLIPIKAIMHETGSLKVMQQVEDVIRRLSSGLNANKHIVPSELLVLCHTLISQNARFLKEVPRAARGKGKGKSMSREMVFVQRKRPAFSESGHYAHNSYRFVAFGLELFNTAFKRSRFDFQDANVVARLEPMVSVIGNTLYSSNGQVTSLALKASASIVKCPLRSIDKSLPVFVSRSIDIIKDTGSSASEIVQTALKSLAAILRDSPKAEVKEKDLIFLLELISPDLEEPARQTAIFAMLRAIVSRKFVVPEIYDVMDKVSEIMVTSQSSQVQELCRGALLQFLLDYPQGKGRLRNSMTFFAKNLSYVHETGRRSVMELLGAVISKFEVTLVREYADLLFVALVMAMANDDSVKCREMAAELIKNLFARMDIDHRRLLVSHLHSWALQSSTPQLAQVSSQVYGLLLDVLHQDALAFVPIILEDMNATLRFSMELSHEIPFRPDFDDQTTGGTEWQGPYQALVVVGKVLREFPDLSRAGKVSWPTIVDHLLYPHSWVRTASCRLLGTLFSSVLPGVPDPELPEEDPLSRQGMEDVAKRLCTQLKSQHLDNALSLQIVKNLFYVGKCFSAIPSWSSVEATSGGQGQSDNEDTDSSDNEASTEAEKSKRSKPKHPLPWLFSRLSYQARSAHIARRNKSRGNENWSCQPASVLRWFAAMATHMKPDQLELFLVHILSPVYRITEDDTIRDPQMEELKNLAVELQDVVREKVGTTTFANTYNRIRQSVLDVQRERKTARATLVTTNPEAAAKRKQDRNASKKDSRKRKNVVFTESKGRIASTKRRKEQN